MKARRVLLGILIGIGCLILLVTGAVIFALSNRGVAKKLIALALGKSPAGLEIGEIRGPLKGPLYLLHIKYRSGALSAEADSVLLDWQPSKLLLGRIELLRLHVTGLHVTLPDSAPPDTAGVARARRQRPVAPLPVVLGDAFISDITVDAPGGVTLRNGMITLGGNLQDYQLAMTGDAFVPQLRAVAVHLTGRGNLEELTLEHSIAELLDGTLAATGTLRWWPRLEWELAIAADSIHPALLLQKPASWPGRVSLYGSSDGVIDYSGPMGRATIDSLRGSLRGQPLSGHAELGFAPQGYDVKTLDVLWGSAHLKAQGVVHDTIAVSYDLAVGDLRTATRRARGSVQAQGTAHGPRLTPRVRVQVQAQNLASGTNRLARLRGSGDVDLARAGRNDVELRGEGAAVAATTWSTAALSLHGTHQTHVLKLDAKGPGDSLRLALAGGLSGRTWRGRLNTLALGTTSLGGWRLEQPVALSASAAAGRIAPLCLAADSAAGRLCGEGDWRGSRTWNVLATVEGIPVRRLGGWTKRLDDWDRGRMTGSLGAHLEAHAVGSRVDGVLRAASDTVALIYSNERNDQVEHRLALDSAVVEVHSSRTGTTATLGVRVNDERNSEVMVLSGTATLPQYLIGRRLAALPIEFRLTGSVPDLRYGETFVARVDTLRGGLLLDLSGSGTLSAPQLKGSLSIANLVAGFHGRRTLGGSAVLGIDGGVGEDRSLHGEIRLTPSGVHFDYPYFGELRRIVMDSAGAVLTAGPGGVQGNLRLGANEAGGKGVASLTAELKLPEYTRVGMRVAAQPVTVRVSGDIPDLRVLQPFTLFVDSLAGHLKLELAVDGSIEQPSVTSTLSLTQGQGRFEPGTWVRGGVAANLNLVAASDRSLTGSLRIEPRELSFDYPVGTGVGVTRVSDRGIEARAGQDGVHATLQVGFTDSTGATFGTLRGLADLPGLTRLGEPLARQPIEATLTGRVADLAFIEAFTSHVDSAAGQLSLDARLNGTVGDSRLVGGVELKDVSIRLPPYGVLLEDLQFKGKGDQEGAISVEGKMRSGGGELTISGSTPVQPTSAQPGHLKIRGTRFEAMHNNELHAVVSPQLDVRIAGDSLDVRGTLDLPLARLMLSQIPANAVAPSDDIILLDSVVARKRPVSVQVRINLGDSVSFSGFNFDAELGGSLLLMQEPGDVPTASGTLRIPEGKYKAYGQDLTIENGEIRFAGGTVDNPGLAIRALRVAHGSRDSVVAGIQIAGTLKKPLVTLFSEPTMSQTQVLSYILTGSPLGGGSGSEGNFVNKALTSLGLRGGNLLTRSVGHHLGLEEAMLQTEGDLKDTSLRVGRFLTPSLYVSYGIGLFDPISTLRLRYVLSNHFTLLAEAGQARSADALLKIEPGKKK